MPIQRYRVSISTNLVFSTHWSTDHYHNITSSSSSKDWKRRGGSTSAVVNNLIEIVTWARTHSKRAISCTAWYRLSINQNAVHTSYCSWGQFSIIFLQKLLKSFLKSPGNIKCCGLTNKGDCCWYFLSSVRRKVKLASCCPGQKGGERKASKKMLASRLT